MLAMNSQKINMKLILPVLMSFFVMSFVDLVGIGVDRVSKDMNLSATLAQLIPSAAFLWFLLLSVPVGVLQAKTGKKAMLNIGMGITALGLLVPFLFYSFTMVLAGFALMGIGNTIVQVSANPLLVNVVPANRSSSFLSFSQFIKAVGSMLGAPLAAVFASTLGDWKLIFLVFGIVSIISVLWLWSAKIDEPATQARGASIISSFRLLGNSFILLMVLGIFLVVGVDVGFNSNSGQFLIKQFGIDPVAAESGRSVYFFGRMLGTFAGAIILTRVPSGRFMVLTSLLGLVLFGLIMFITSPAVAWVVVFLIGLAVANIWPLIFSFAVAELPERSNEISGLVMMAVSGGAVIPFLAGWMSDMAGVKAGIAVLAACMVYLLFISVYASRRK